MRPIRESESESGSVLIITLLVLAALTILGIATISLSGLDGEIAINQRSGDQALYVAEAGVYYGAEQVRNNNALIAGPGTTLAPTQIMNGATAVSFPGVNQPAEMSVYVGQAPDQNGNTIQCGLVGYSDRFGSQRFQVYSTGKGPGGASRQVQAILTLPPQEGVCPPGKNVAGCSYAGGC